MQSVLKLFERKVIIDHHDLGKGSFKDGLIINDNEDYTNKTLELLFTNGLIRKITTDTKYEDEYLEGKIRLGYFVEKAHKFVKDFYLKFLILY